MGGGITTGTAFTRLIRAYAPFNIIDIAAGSYHTLMVKSNGKVYSFGRNDEGQLGIGSLSLSNFPTEIVTENVWKISTIDKTSLILQSTNNCSGKVYNDPLICSGRGICISDNQCSCPSDYHGSECEFTTCFGKNSSLSSTCSGNGVCNALNLCTCNTGFSGSECELNYHTETHTLVYAAGQNYHGQLGNNVLTLDPTTTFQLVVSENYYVSKVFAGFEQSFLVKNFSRKAFGFGRNSIQQLNDGSTTHRSTPVILEDQDRNEIDFIASGGEYSLILFKDKNVFGVGLNTEGELGVGHKQEIHTLQPMVGTNYDVKKICSQTSHSLIIKDNTRVYGFGKNNVRPSILFFIF